jgi:hypothetical protein
MRTKVTWGTLAGAAEIGKIGNPMDGGNERPDRKFESPLAFGGVNVMGRAARANSGRKARRVEGEVHEMDDRPLS